jgi:hypothetical protein
MGPSGKSQGLGRKDKSLIPTQPPARPPQLRRICPKVNKVLMKYKFFVALNLCDINGF